RYRIRARQRLLDRRRISAREPQHHQPARLQWLRYGRPRPRPQRGARTPQLQVQLERDEFRFAPPLNQSPFVPAEAGTQGGELGQRTGSPLPRGRTESRGDSSSTHRALGGLASLRHLSYWHRPWRELLRHQLDVAAQIVELVGIMP